MDFWSHISDKFDKKIHNLGYIFPKLCNFWPNFTILHRQDRPFENLWGCVAHGYGPGMDNSVQSGSKLYKLSISLINCACQIIFWRCSRRSQSFSRSKSSISPCKIQSELMECWTACQDCQHPIYSGLHSWTRVWLHEYICVLWTGKIKKSGAQYNFTAKVQASPRHPICRLSCRVAING